MLGNTNITIKPNEKVDYVDWIESTGTQWIDTEIIPKLGYKAEIKFQATVAPTSSESWIYGVWATEGYRCGLISSGFDASRGFTYSQTSNYTEITIATGENNTQDYGISAYLFSQNENGTAKYTAGSKYKLYYCKIYSSDNVLVRNFKPCKDSAGIFCLYDTVTKKYFYNKGTGYFEGPNPKQVEYIESSGTQWMDTGVIMTANTGIELKFAMNEQKGGAMIMGSWDSSLNGFLLGIYDSSPNGFKYAYANSAWNGSELTYDTNIHIAKVDNTGAKIDDSVLATAGNKTLASTSTIRIWQWGSQSGSFSYAKAKVYSMKIYNSGTLAYAFIPVYIGTYCLYDTVNKKYYYNKGTGTFTGADSLFSGDTVCLLNFEDNLTDDTGLNAVTMSAGEAVYVDGKFNKSIKLDGSAYVSIPLTENNTLGTNDFTIAGWFKFDKNTGNQDLFSHNYNYSSSYYWQGLAVWRSDGYKGLCFHCDLSATTKNRCNTEVDVEANKWYHVALVRSNGVVKLYLNGTSIGSLSANGTVYQNTNATWKIGSSSLTSDNPNIREPFYGQVDNFMIINGKALWTENFVPSDSPYGTSEV